MNALEKATASAIDCGLAVGAGALAMPITDRWRELAVLAMFGYNIIFAERSPGMMITGIRSNRPLTLLYNLVYTITFSLILFSWFLLSLYAIAQILCVHFTGTTVPGLLTGYQTRRQ
jgi:hypothetical protein